MSCIPLLEVAFEIRFQPRNNLATELLLETNKQFPNSLTVKNSEGLKFPEEIKAHENELYYVPSYKVVYEDFTLLISDGSLAIQKNYVTGQYKGWNYFKPTVLNLIRVLENRDASSAIERISLKYTNLFSGEYLSNDLLAFNISLGEKKFNVEDNFELRTQSVDEPYITMLRASSKMGVINICDVNGTETHLNGFLFVIDLITNRSSFEKNDIETDLEELHKRVSEEFQNINPANTRII